MTNLYHMLPEEIDKLVTGMGQPRYRADQLLQALYHESPKDISDLRQIPKAMRDALVAAGYTICSASEVHRVASKDGQTTKLLLKYGDGTMIETVLMQYPSKDKGHPRSTVCVSTQVGCAMGCVFCASGLGGVVFPEAKICLKFQTPLACWIKCTYGCSTTACRMKIRLSKRSRGS